MNILNGLIILLFLVVLIPSEPAQALNADEIIVKANMASYYAGDDGKARVKMSLLSKSGKKRYREITILRKDMEDGGQQKFYVYFHEPRDVSKMVFMVWKHVGKDADLWI